MYAVLKPVLLQKEKAEEHLMEVCKRSGMKGVVIRPGGLKTAPKTGTAVLTEDTNACGPIHRADVAACVVSALLSDKADNKILTAVDPAQLPGGEKLVAFST